MVQHGMCGGIHERKAACCIRRGRLVGFLYVISFDILLAGTNFFIAVVRKKLLWTDPVLTYICRDEQRCTQLTRDSFNWEAARRGYTLQHGLYEQNATE